MTFTFSFLSLIARVVRSCLLITHNMFDLRFLIVQSSFIFLTETLAAPPA